MATTPISLVEQAFRQRNDSFPGATEYKLATYFLFAVLSEQDKYALATIVKKGHMGSLRPAEARASIRHLRLLGFIEPTEIGADGYQHFSVTELGKEIHSQKTLEVARHVEWFCGLREGES